MTNEITEKLDKILEKNNIYTDEPMSKHTSFKIGGLADYYLKIQTIQELQDVLKLAKEENIPIQIVGNGSNLLVREGGLRGFVMKLEFDYYHLNKKGDMAYITVRMWYVTC